MRRLQMSFDAKDESSGIQFTAPPPLPNISQPERSAQPTKFSPILYSLVISMIFSGALDNNILLSSYKGKFPSRTKNLDFKLFLNSLNKFFIS